MYVLFIYSNHSSFNIFIIGGDETIDNTLFKCQIQVVQDSAEETTDSIEKKFEDYIAQTKNSKTIVSEDTGSNCSGDDDLSDVL
jgi:hypothetical protein